MVEPDLTALNYPHSAKGKEDIILTHTHARTQTEMGGSMMPVVCFLATSCVEHIRPLTLTPPPLKHTYTLRHTNVLTQFLPEESYI